MRSLNATTCAAVLVSVVASFSWSSHAFASSNPTAIIFGVFNDTAMHNASLEPIVVLSGDKYVEPPAYRSAPDASKFIKRYLSQGTTYRLLHGAVYAGDTTVMSASDLNISATVEATKPPEEMLATDSKILGKRKNGFPQVSKKTAAEFLELAKQVFRTRGASPAAVASTSVVHLTATALKRDGMIDYVGNAFVRQQKPPVIYTAFLIAQYNKGRLDIVFNDFSKIQPKDLMAGTTMKDINPDFLAPRFLDHLDINQDGTHEVFYVYPSFEGVHYGIYQNKSGKWKRTYEHYRYITAF